MQDKVNLYLPTTRHRNYFKLDNHDRDFVQKMLFSDYLNSGIEDDPKDMVEYIHIKIVNDLDYYIHEEEYEMAQLLYDIIEKFEERLEYY